MTFTIETFKKTAGPVAVDDIDFGQFAREPLSEDGLRCLQYMHDIEYHTIRYLADLLNTPASRNSDVGTFLTLWNHEEFWHGEAIARVLRAHGVAGGLDIEIGRRNGGHLAEMVRGIPMRIVSAVSPNFEAIYLTWGAINEWTAHAAYQRLASQEDHPLLTQLLRRIMKQEGRHAAFYSHFARRRLVDRRLTQRATRAALGRFWAPVGTGVASLDEVDFVNRHLFGDRSGRAVARRIDARVDRLPGLSGLALVERAVLSAGSTRRRKSLAGRRRGALRPLATVAS